MSSPFQKFDKKAKHLCNIILQLDCYLSLVKRTYQLCILSNLIRSKLIISLFIDFNLFKSKKLILNLIKHKFAFNCFYYINKKIKKKE